MRSAVLPALIAAATLAGGGAAQSLSLTVPAGAPLRVYLTQRVPKRIGQPVHAKLLEPVFAFDRQVIPAGAEISGEVVRLDPVPKMQRATALLGGDFTPLHRAQIKFTEVTLTNNVHLPLKTVESVGLLSVYDPPKPKKPKPGKAAKDQSKSDHPGATASDGGVLHQGKVAVKDQVNAHTRGIVDIVRAPNKKEKVEDYLWSRVPYHPQWVRTGTRFDAELAAPLDFGSATLKPSDLTLLGTQPPRDSVVHGRLTSSLDSGTASVGDAVEAVVSAPLFSPDRKLILPAGTRLLGKVTTAEPARWFHRGGRLRFSFETLELGPESRALAALAPAPESKVLATLGGAEGSGKTPVKVDDEGTVKSTERKTRFIAPALALLVATRAADSDEGHAHSGGTAGNQNTGGRTLGGISGFGAFGAIAARISPTVASALGYYGLGWSVYSTIISRGAEVEFQRNAALDVRFGGRRDPAPPSAARMTGTH